LNKGSKNGLTSGNNAYVAKTKIKETAISRKNSPLGSRYITGVM